MVAQFDDPVTAQHNMQSSALQVLVNDKICLALLISTDIVATMGDKENLDLTMKIGEDTQLHNLRGYPKVAHLMGSRPHYAIFRKFGRLTILNLLRLQAELLAVEDEIEHCLVKDDSSSDTNVKSYAVNFRKLNNAKAPHDEQRELLAKSLKKLANYREQLCYISARMS